MEWSVLFMGPVGAGKSQAIRTISDIDVVDTDERASDEVLQLKSHTTVSMDVGTLHLTGQDKLRLYGAPGQDRFDFMWDILLEQSKGIILVLNHASPDPLADLEHYLQAIEERLPGRRVPLVIGISHADLQIQRPLSMYREHLLKRGCRISDTPPPVLDMDARDRRHVHACLVAITAQLEMAERFARRATVH